MECAVCGNVRHDLCGNPRRCPRQVGEVAKLREALKPFAAIDIRQPFQGVIPGAVIKVADVKRAKAALS